MVCKPNARRLKHLACDHAHSFTHQKGLSYQIFELEDSGLPQQGILPISAKKTITMATEVWKKDSPHCALFGSKREDSHLGQSLNPDYAVHTLRWMSLDKPHE